MSAHHGRRLDFAAGDHFSFSQPVHDNWKYNTWAESIKTTQNPFGRRESERKFGPWARKIPRSDSASDGFSDGDGEENSSGTASPPLWKPESSEPRPKCSRVQMIADYRQEMMDLVHNLPETAYELTLRDIVESPAKLMRETTAEREEATALTDKEMKEKRKRRSSSRNGSMDAGGFLLRFFIPSKLAVVCGCRAEACRDSGMGWARPVAAAAAYGEWFNSESGERNWTHGSPNSSCCGRSRKRWKLSACFAFLCRNRSSRSREL